MKAVVVRAFGPCEEVDYGELPDPVAGEGEVVVDVHASEANFPDILYVEGTYQTKPPCPFSPGLAGAGRVAAVGPGVTGVSVGQRVLTLPRYGTHAEKVAVPADLCFPMPDDMPYDVAAALGLVYQSSYFALADRGALRPGETVLVLGATGGIGMAALQLAKPLGASRVIAATRGAAGARLAREMGAEAVIDTAMDDLKNGLRRAVLDLTDGRGADVIIDPVGGEVTGAALRALAWRGRLVVVGFAAGTIPSVAANYLLVKNISVSGLQWTDYRARCLDRVHEAQRHIFSLWESGVLRPRIARVEPLRNAAAVFADLRAGRISGKVVFNPRAGEA